MANNSTSHGKMIKCSNCNCPMRVEEDTQSGMCWKCTNEEITKRFEEKKSSEGKKPRRSKKNSEKKSKPRKNNVQNHMSPESIRKRFDETPRDKKIGFFQEVFLIIKDHENIPVRSLSEKAFKLSSKPEKYTTINKIEDQIKYYCKEIWGRKSNLVKLINDSIQYNGKK